MFSIFPSTFPLKSVRCLQLQEQVKDSHVSEIIDVYEQKLGAYAVSTSGLRKTMNTAVMLQTSNHAV